MPSYPGPPVGLVNLETLEAITNVVRKYDIPIVKITSGQRMALVGMKADVIDDIWKDLGTDIGRASELCVHYAQACPGTAVCKFGVQDSLGMALELEKMYVGIDLAGQGQVRRFRVPVLLRGRATSATWA